MKNILILLLLAIPVFYSCEDYLEEEAYSELAPENFLTTPEGIESVLNSAFGAGFINGYDAHSVYDIQNWCTDIEWETAGGENSTAVQIINFNWGPSTTWINGVMWERPYRAIRNANILLENVDKTKISDETKALYKAEARFMRALSYIHLYSWFGPVPLRTNTQQPSDLARATDEEMRTFLETELTEVAPVLPDPGKEAAHGLPTKGGAYALLCKYYLNTKQWQKCADAAQKVIELNYYILEPSYVNMFKVENENNKEYILVDPQHANGFGNNYMCGAFPPNFYSDPVTGLVNIGWVNWGAQYRLYDSFYNSFDPKDKRKNCILTSYINTSKQTVSLLNSNNTRSFKFWPDPDAIGNEHGNDIPEIRYADILLSKAEALNMLNGPNSESINLINSVRGRAGVDVIKLEDFPTTESLNAHLLKERGWELYCEVGIRREDQIRMGTFISSAIARGKTSAKATHVLFPIPQLEMNSNNKITKNNDGY